MNLKEVINKSKFVKKKNNISFTKAFVDILKSMKNNKCSLDEYMYYEFYSLNEKERNTFLTTKINNEFIKKYNKEEDKYKIDDISNFNSLYKDYLYRNYIDLREVSFKEFKEFILNKDKIVVKDINKNMEVVEIDKDKLKNEYNILKVYNSIMKKEQYVVEEFILQNKDLNKIYKEGMNYLKVISFMDADGNEHILKSLFMVGGIEEDAFAIINNEGIVITPAIDGKRVYNNHPKSYNRIVGFEIPNYTYIKEFVSILHKRIPSIKYISYVIAMTESGLSVISGSSSPKVYQIRPSVSGIKTGDLEYYKQFMKE